MQVRKILLLILFFTVITTIYTWPLVLHFNTAIFGIWGGKYGGDVFATIYSYWWAQYSVSHDIPVYENPLIAYPFGVEGIHVFGLRAPAELFTGAFIARFVNEVFAYNMLLFLSFVLAGLFAYILVRHITKNQIAAMIAGVIYAFSPYHLYVSMGWLELSQIQWIPLYFFCLIKTYETKSFSWGILSGLVLSLISLTTLYYGYFMAVMSVVFICFKITYDLLNKNLPDGRRFDWQFFKNFIFGMGVSLLIVMVGFYRYFLNAELFQTPYDVYKLEGVIVRSSRLPDFLMPSVDHPLFGNFVKNFRDAHILSTHDVMDIFVGYAPLFLACYGIFGWLKKRVNDPLLKFSMLLFITFMISAVILSFPPVLEIKGATIYTPSYLMYLISPMFKTIARYNVVVMCALSVLAGVGLKHIMDGSSTAKKKAIAFAILLGLILLEFQNSNMIHATQSYKTPEVYNWLAAQPGKFAIAEYPAFTSLDYRNMYYKFFQRIHNKAMMNGAPERSKEDAIRMSVANLTTPGVPKMLNFLGIKYVIIHENFYDGLDIVNIYPPSVIEGLKLVKRFGDERVYEVIAKYEDIIIIPFEAFYPPERDKDGKLWRWLRDSAHINFFNTKKEDIPVTISFKAKSFGKKHWINIRHEKDLWQIEIPASDAYLVELKSTLLPGSNMVRFYVDCCKPEKLIDPSGAKDVSIYMGDLQVRSENGNIYEE